MAEEQKPESGLVKKGQALKTGQKLLKRSRANTTVTKTTNYRTPASLPMTGYSAWQGAVKREYASAGRFTTFVNGKIGNDSVAERITAIRNQARGEKISPGQGIGLYERMKTASLFADGSLGTADIADSQNIGYYSFEFPVDALEMPSSRAEELRFFRLAYDRDPIVGRAIDLHTEIPLSKLVLEKPKCSNEEFADYIYDFFQGLMSDTKLFMSLLEGCREYWTIGETFFFVEETDDVEVCPEAKKQLNKKESGKDTQEGKEAENSQLNDGIMDYLRPEKKSAWIKKRSAAINALLKAGIKFSFDEPIEPVLKEIKAKKASFQKKFVKYGMLIARPGADDNYPIQVTAEMSKVAQPPVGDAPAVDPVTDVPTPDAPGDVPADPNAPGAVDPGAPQGDAALGDIAGGGGAPMGGGGGGAPIPVAQGQASEVKDAIAKGESIAAARELMEMRHYLKLLERKKELLEELKKIREDKKEELELFGHLVNPEYRGFFRVQILPPEQIEIANEGTLIDGPTIYYKPPEDQKQAYLEDADVPSEVKDMIQQEGKIPLNSDPFQGSYVIHFARKKSGYELHGRSILQRCLRTVIYREKLRQVQTTIASRNMTPKTLVVADGIPISEVATLRAHIDEAKADPDYSVVVNYACQWNEIGSEGRLLVLDGEWNHTNSDLAIGLGFSPEILIGEGMYGNGRTQLELMNTTYTQFRDLISGIIEDQMFKPIAMKKGFYEMDKYGRPRWIVPKVTFSRMALRDSGDLYDMLFNLYSKGSLPVDIILEFLNVDPEDCKRKLEDNLFTVNDSKFNEMLSAIYSSMGEWLIAKTDLGKRITKGLTLDEVDNEAEEGKEGTGEGM
jgi:hypothetical protein